MASDRISSILAADFGSVKTRVVLFDVVDGEYRLVAHAGGRTTLGYPDDDLSVGLRRLLTDITGFTGREFYNQMGRVVTPEDRSRNGVDYFITTASAGRPIRAILVGLVPEISITSALRAMSGTYIEMVSQFHLRDGMSEHERLNAIMLGRPDIIFVAGGTDGGAFTALEEILDVVELGLRVQEESLRPMIVFAGNNSLHNYMEHRFGELTQVLISENIRPDMRHEVLDHAQAVLAEAFDTHRETHGLAFSSVGDMSSTGLLPTAQSYNVITEYYARTGGKNVISLDMGSTSTILSASFDGETSTQIDTGIGLGQSAITLLDATGKESIADWLPFYPEAGEIRNYAMNKLSRPASVPMALRDMFIEQAFMRAGIRHMVRSARKNWKNVKPAGLLPPVDLVVIGGGAMNGPGHGGYEMMLIADCLQPTGITEIKADRYGVIPPLNAIARSQPDAAVHIMDGDSLEHVGTLISLEGRSNREGIAAKLTITLDGEPAKIDLKIGEILRLDVPRTFELQIRINCQRNFRVAGKRRLKLTLHGGTGGIMIDARGRSLDAPDSVEKRMELLPKWIMESTDEELPELPEEWAITQEEPEQDIDIFAIAEEEAEPEPTKKEAKAVPAEKSDLFEDSEVDLFAEDESGSDTGSNDDDDLRGLFD